MKILPGGAAPITRLTVCMQDIVVPMPKCIAKKTVDWFFFLQNTSFESNLTLLY